ncbi:hypothetical protein ACFLT8_01885 [Chloroflexota bacterium]
MTMDAGNGLSKRRILVDLIIGVLVFGSIWGFLEAVLGGFLNLIIFPNKGAIMSSIGVTIMAAAMAYYRKPVMLPCIGIVAASFKWFNAWLLFIPLNRAQVINPAMAIFLESLAFTLVAALLMDRIRQHIVVGAGAGVLAGFMSAIAYVYFAVYVTHSPIFERLGIESIGEFIMGNAVIQAAFFGTFLPLGYLAGEKLATMSALLLTRRSFYYACSVATIALCWGISAIAFKAGL